MAIRKPRKKKCSTKIPDDKVYRDYVRKCKVCRVRPATYLKWLELSRRLVLPGDVLE